MNFSRRQFLLTGATLASGSMLQSFDFLNENTQLKNFGVQLYTLRDDLPKDPKGVLKQLAGFGYKQVESFEGPKGFFWGMTNKEFKSYMDSLGMRIVSSHCDFRKDFERKAAEAGEIGMKYLICPYLGPQKSLDGFKKAADDFNKAGEICKKNGLRFAYHNHNYSFNMQEGQLPQDVMMQNTDPALVDFEMDIYWVVSAGADPIEWLKKYPNRFRLCHIKDRAKNAAPTNFDASVDLGLGSIDFKSILAEGKKLGFKYHIVEQEKYENTTPLKSAEVDAAYLKSLKF
jgi:sugar phosphate isomerase/epimerase